MAVADISSELAAISNAQYGSDVRQAMHDGLEKVNNGLSSVVTTTTVTVSNQTVANGGTIYISIPSNNNKKPIGCNFSFTSRTSKVIIVGSPVVDGSSIETRLYNISGASNTISGILTVYWI